MADLQKYGRTENLFDCQTMSDGLVGSFLNSDGTITTNVASSSWTITKYIPVAGREFTLQRQASGGATSICLYDSNRTYITGLAYNGNGTVTVSANTDVSYIRFTYYRTENKDNIMLNEGSTAKPFEPYGNTWHSTPHYIHNTSTDTITTLPAVLYPNDTTATVGLKGNMSQTGTPTLDNPIMPQSCGERTGNEWNVTLLPNSSISSDNNWEKYDSSTVTTTMYMLCEGNTTYYLYTPSSITSGIFRVYTSISDTIPRLGNSIPVYEKTRSSSPVSLFKFTTGANDKMLIVQVITANSQTMADNAVLDKGYKIPILSADTTTPVYLGEVETTRKIKKLVLTGEETTWTKASSSKVFYLWQYDDDALNSANIISCMCSHYSAQGNVAAVSGVENLKCCFRTTAQTFYIHDDAFESNTDFVTYLQQQYANGTPVTVWYVLAAPTTGIVNEPLRKIGEYVDTVGGISIPTITGADSFDVLTTLKPSEVSLSYTGWHDATVKEWDGSQWQ